MKLTHKDLDIEIELAEPITQGLVEAFFRELREYHDDPDAISVAEYSGDVVRAARATEMLNGATPVEDMAPNAVMWVRNQIIERVTEAMTIPPE